MTEVFDQGNSIYFPLFSFLYGNCTYSRKKTEKLYDLISSDLLGRMDLITAFLIIRIPPTGRILIYLFIRMTGSNKQKSDEVIYIFAISNWRIMVIEITCSDC